MTAALAIAAWGWAGVAGVAAALVAFEVLSRYLLAPLMWIALDRMRSEGAMAYMIRELRKVKARADWLRGYHGAGR